MENSQKDIYKLNSCIWEITLKCCFSCMYCGSKAGKARENELSTEECIDVASQLIEMGCNRVSLIGGEVFMRDDWQVVVKSLTNAGVNVSVITNGFICDDEIIKEIKRLNVSMVSVSLDGNERIHDRYRQEGSFQRAVKTIDALTEKGIPVSVITTLHKNNIECLNDLFDVLKQKKIRAWQLQACSPMGNAADGFWFQFGFKKAMDFVEQNMMGIPFSLGIADNIGYFTRTEGCLRGDRFGRHSFTGCKAGISCIGIDSVGNVRGCESLYDESFIEGNLRERTLSDIWNDPKAFKYNRGFNTRMLTGKCSNCTYGNICRGGCRSYNFFSSGKLYESAFCIRDNPKE